MPDPTTEQLVLDLLTALDPDPADAQRSYIDRLRRLQQELVDALALGAAPLSAEQEQAVRQFVGRTDPHPDDAQQDSGMMLRRALALVDGELFKWTSGMVQPAGPSGATAVAAHEVPAEAQSKA